jgi:hypothetical protein
MIAEFLLAHLRAERHQGSREMREFADDALLILLDACDEGHGGSVRGPAYGVTTDTVAPTLVMPCSQFPGGSTSLHAVGLPNVMR